MPRTKEQMAEYQRERRAQMAERHAAAQEALKKLPPIEAPKIIKGVSKRAAAVVVVEDGKAAVREFNGPSGYHYLPGDEVIGKMTQKQRDIILNKLPKTNVRER